MVSIESVTVDDAVASCDSDGHVDAGETGRVVVRVANGGAAPLTGASLTVSSTLEGVSFPKGATQAVPTTAPFSTADVVFEVSVAPSTSPEMLDVKVDLSAASACTTSATFSVSKHANVNEVSASSAKDDVEAATTTWTAKGLDAHAFASTIWKREEVTPGARAWRATDHESPSDTVLESPTLDVGAGPFSVSFSHRYRFEVGDGQNYDGAVVEVSTDDGQTWADASTLSSPSYGGTIGDFVYGAQNTLKGRQGYVGQSQGWPGRTTETLAFGTALANQSVKVRFRVATDNAAGEFGWEIDDIQISGATNTPFASLIAEDSVCVNLPTANAGADQKVASGALVTLDGSGGSGHEGGAIAFAWTQTGGPSVALSSASTATPTFTAPAVTAETKLTFQLKVQEGSASATDSIDVRVEPPSGAGPEPSADAGSSAPPTEPTEKADTDAPQAGPGAHPY
ncbi:MAG TPA: peptidase, partial [Labilithrix sp.]|nr:peptidase [Labilithrix sp.]